MAYQKAKIRFYHALATMLDAGVPLVRALQQQHPAPFGKVGKMLAEKIDKESCSLSDAFQQSPAFFDEFECRLTLIGEQTGKLDIIFNSLSEWYDKNAKLKKQIISTLVYPFFLYHLAAVALPFLFSLTMQMETSLKIMLTGAIILFLSMLPYLLFAGYKILKVVFKHVLVGPLDGINAIFLRIPVVGALVRKLTYARFFFVYSLSLDAGLSVIDSIRLAASVCRHEYLRERFLRTADYCEEHRCPFFEAFAEFVFGADRDSVMFPIMETGETTGKTAESAKHLADQFGEEADSSITFLAGFLPKLFYIFLVIVIAACIILFAVKNLFAALNKLGGM